MKFTMIQLYCFPGAIARKCIHMLSEAAEGVLRLNTIRNSKVVHIHSNRAVRHVLVACNHRYKNLSDNCKKI